MNRDLEETLGEMGPEYRALVARLRAGGDASAAVRPSWRPWLLAAASLLVSVGIAAVFFSRPSVSVLRPLDCPREYRASVDEMIATQNSDGSWQSDFLTRRNAAILRACTDPASRIAYKKAMRNMRLRGIL